MSSIIEQFLPDLNDIADTVSGVDVRVISGAYNNTVDAFKSDLFQSIRNMIAFGFGHTLDELLPQVAKDTGQTKQSIFSMFSTQVIGLADNISFRIAFDRQLLSSPFWLKYHDIEWELNPNFNPLGYKKPTTPGTRPFSEKEWIIHLFGTFVNQLLVEWTKLGFNFTIRRQG